MIMKAKMLIIYYTADKIKDFAIKFVELIKEINDTNNARFYLAYFDNYLYLIAPREEIESRFERLESNASILNIQIEELKEQVKIL